MKPTNSDPLLDLLDSAKPQGNPERRDALEDRLVAQLYAQPVRRSRFAVPVTLVATLLVVFAGVLILTTIPGRYPAATTLMTPTQIPTNSMLVLATPAVVTAEATEVAETTPIIFASYSLYMFRNGETLPIYGDSFAPIIGDRVTLYIRLDLYDMNARTLDRRLLSQKLVIAEQALISAYLGHADEYVIDIPNDVLPTVQWLLQNGAIIYYEPRPVPPY